MRFLSLLCLLPALGAEARDFTPYFLETGEEVRLAATAAPAAVSKGASYYVLGETGFERHVEGTNGWHCFVERAFFVPLETGPDGYDASVRAPHCINTHGAETRMQEVFMRARLALAGHDRDAVDQAVDAAFAAGALIPPSKLALTYMMSPEQWLGEAPGHWHPHLMFWIPYLENDAAGGHPELGKLPFVTAGPGSRSAVLVVPVEPYGEAHASK